MSHHRTKKKIENYLVVYNKKFVNVAELIIPAPIGVDIDPKSGEITVPVQITPLGDVVLNSIIKNDILINEGFIKTKLFFDNPDPEPCPDVRKGITKVVIVPIQSIHQIDRLCYDDHVQKKVKIKAIIVRGFPDNSTPKSIGRKINLIIKIILEVKLIIFREEIVCIPSCK